MRIIAGENRGRKLKAVSGTGTRPTADRVKEAVFSALGSRVTAAKVLDVFGGTGNISLEALSRGADLAIILERDHKALLVIQENIKSLNAAAKCRVQKGDSLLSLEKLAKEQIVFDIIYIDPPYQEAGLYQRVLELIKEGKLLKSDGMIVVEAARNACLTFEDLFCVFKEKNYGDTKIVYLEYCEAEEESK